MARLEYRYGQLKWVDVHVGDILPCLNQNDYFEVKEDMINPDGTLKHKSYYSNSNLHKD